MTFQPLLTLAELRAAEQQSLRLLPPGALMERAGSAAAAWILAHFPGRGEVRVLAGPGNNGGDGWVTAHALRRAGVEVRVLCADGPAPLPPDADRARQRYCGEGGPVLHAWPEDGAPRLIVDALFGIGRLRPLQPPHATWIARCNAADCPVVALDVPSGLDAGSGIAQSPTVRATHTLTFIAGKAGLYTGDGPDHCGTISVLGLEVPAAGSGALLAESPLLSQWPRRRRNTHKGQFGAVGVLGGAPGFAGAAMLAAEAALQCGAGRVWLAALDPALGSQAVLRCPELMTLDPATLLSWPPLTTLVAGPGLGQSGAAIALLEQALTLPSALVLDADALTLLGSRPEWARRLRQRTAPTLLTPHPGEARRLLPELPEDRVTAALALARHYGSLVVLKGCGSVVAEPESGRWWINPTGNAGLSAPGMGDVLAGALGALLAQGLNPLTALQLAVHAHGAAAEDCAVQGQGPIGLSAREVTVALRRRLNRHL